MNNATKLVLTLFAGAVIGQTAINCLVIWRICKNLVAWQQWKAYADERYLVVTNIQSSGSQPWAQLDSVSHTGTTNYDSGGTNWTVVKRTMPMDGPDDSEAFLRALNTPLTTWSTNSFPANYTTLIYEKGRELIEMEGNCRTILYHFTDAEWDILKMTYPNHLHPNRYRGFFVGTNDWSKDHQVSEIKATNQPDAWPLDLPVSGK